jgi:hypothetical protein
VVSAKYAALDATSMPVLDIDHPLGIRTATLWLLQGEGCYSYFMYAESTVKAAALDIWSWSGGEVRRGLLAAGFRAYWSLLMIPVLFTTHRAIERLPTASCLMGAVLQPV